MGSRFTVAITADAAQPDGSSVHGDLRLRDLEEHGIAWRVLDRYVNPIPPADLADVDAVYSLGHLPFDEELVSQLPRLKLVARFGAGVDTIDLDACTRAGVVVTNTPEAIRTPLALATVTMLLGVAHRLVAKDSITRRSAWRERSEFRGAPMRGRTVGIVGFGGVGSEVARMLQALGFAVIGNNRSGRSPQADALGVELVERDELLARSDFVVLCAALTSETARMIGARELGLMKSSAALINMGRGGLVDTDALRQALKSRTIDAAGLDVFDPEPLDPDDELLSLPNVTLSPHALCWTADFTEDVTRDANASIIAVAEGRRPERALNPAVFETAAWQRKAEKAASVLTS
ncbi:Lactate dehydrogenase [Paramicrobacterium humi]|uniref:Lactate dehydrogenase n=1 Tax=Paramicrobacterium humi TaxID=640635 RepID=A0A1H4LI77_9MICO|nr:D-isomer specific 2-hydroxyacid dehydrogenase family protein [Microbacterium humi]SEB70384.1 Lactate dehydrogenase [Microbacterium humi]